MIIIILDIILVLFGITAMASISLSGTHEGQNE
jgi:hypothetical protein